MTFVVDWHMQKISKGCIRNYQDNEGGIYAITILIGLYFYKD